jgi:hypothetical protein
MGEGKLFRQESGSMSECPQGFLSKDGPLLIKLPPFGQVLPDSECPPTETFPSVSNRPVDK